MVIYMGNIGYLLKRIKGMNYKQMFDTIDFVHTKNNKSKTMGNIL